MRLPNLNDLIRAKGATPARRGKRRPSMYGALKRKWSQAIAICARTQDFARITRPAHFAFEFIEPNKRRDPDGISGGGQKLILDALQDAGLLRDDGWDEVLSIASRWRVDKVSPGVRVTVTEECVTTPIVAGARVDRTLAKESASPRAVRVKKDAVPRVGARDTAGPVKTLRVVRGRDAE
jgi:Holliday junction resolvase RusA-like endonuclease